MRANAHEDTVGHWIKENPISNRSDSIIESLYNFVVVVETITDFVMNDCKLNRNIDGFVYLVEKALFELWENLIILVSTYISIYTRNPGKYDGSNHHRKVNTGRKKVQEIRHQLQLDEKLHTDTEHSVLSFRFDRMQYGNSVPNKSSAIRKAIDKSQYSCIHIRRSNGDHTVNTPE